MTKRTVTITTKMFERLLNVIKLCDHPDILDVALDNEFNDTLYYYGGQTITVSHWNKESERRVHVEFSITQLVEKQRTKIIAELAAMIQRDIKNIIEDTITDAE
jgi:hypothetical protein